MIVRNVFARWTADATNIVLALFTTPLLVHYLGKSDYGLWLLFVNLGAMFNVLDCGIGLGVQRQVAFELGREDSGAAVGVAATGLMLYGVVALVVLAAYAVIACFAGSIFAIPPGRETVSVLVLAWLALAQALAFPARVFEGVILAQEKHHLVGGIETVSALLRFGAMVGVLLVGYRLLGVAAAYSGTLLVQYGVLGLTFLHVLKPMGGLRLAVTRKRVRVLVGYGARVMLGTIGTTLRERGPTMLLGYLANPVSVAYFSVGQRLGAYSTTAVTTAVSVSQPRYTSLHAQEEDGHIRRLFLRSTAYASFLAGFLALMVVALGKPFFLLWLGPGFLMSFRVALIMALPVALFLSVRPCEIYLLALGLHKITGLVTLAESVLALAACLVLVPRWEATGAAVAVAAAFLLIRPWVLPVYVCRRAGIPLRIWWWTCLRRGWLPLLAAALPLYGLFRVWTVDTWLELVAAGLTICLVCAAGLFTLGLDAEERAFWRQKLAGLRDRLARRGA